LTSCRPLHQSRRRRLRKVNLSAYPLFFFPEPLLCFAVDIEMSTADASTWLSPPLHRTTRKALHPKQLDVDLPKVTSSSSAQELLPPRPRSGMNFVNSRTIGALSSYGAVQYSSFTHDGCFPLAVNVRDPLRRSGSSMSRQLEQRASKLERQRLLSNHASSHASAAQELRVLQATPVLLLRPASAMSTTPSDDASRDAATDVPVLRVEIPLAGHPLARASSANPRSGAPGARSRPQTGSAMHSSAAFAKSTPDAFGDAVDVLTIPRGKRAMMWTVKKATDEFSIAGESSTQPMVDLNALIRETICRPPSRTAAATVRSSTAGDDGSVRPLQRYV
jgi:hypothetical protein